MSQHDTKQIVAWLKDKLGTDAAPYDNPFWNENEFAYGDTECGFSSAFTINYEKLEQEMDEWIAQTFNNSSEST